MKIQELNHKTVCIIGYGREGQAVHNALRKFAPEAKVTVADMNPHLVVEGAELQLGDDYLRDFERFDVVVKSPGVKRSQAVDSLSKERLTTSTRIFMDTVLDSGVQVVGITGSKGKSTTTNLIFHALRAHNTNTFLMGNIGIPMIDFLDEAKPGVNFIIELSSYQLEDLTVSPHVAVITNLFAEHLDYHGSIQAYFAAKQHIAEFQKPGDAVFYNALSDEATKMASISAGEQIGFTPDDFPLPMAQTKLKGEHNRSNLAAAYKVALRAGVPAEIALEALKNTEGLPYRLYSHGIHGGIEWVDDSLSTAPEATIFGLEALGPEVDTLITGGMNRGLDFTALGKYITESSIRNLILFPDSGEEVKKYITRDINFVEVTSMQDAVEFARLHTEKGKMAVLSSASPSYNLFKNYEDKSAQFVEAITNV